MTNALHIARAPAHRAAMSCERSTRDAHALRTRDGETARSARASEVVIALATRLLDAIPPRASTDRASVSRDRATQDVLTAAHAPRTRGGATARSGRAIEALVCDDWSRAQATEIRVAREARAPRSTRHARRRLRAGEVSR